MFLVVRLWDAFADLIAGRLVDRTMTRWGKFRPFILFFAVPLLFLSFLTFRVPAGLGDGTKLLYAYLTYAVLGLLYSLVNIPYGSLASAMTQSVNERAKLVAARAFGAAVGGVLLSYYIGAKVSDVRKLRTTLAPADYQARVQSIFTQTTLAFIVLGSICYFLTVLLTKEGVVRTQPSVSMKETFATLKVNKPLGILCAASFFYLIGLFAVGGSSAYYAQYILGDIAYTGPMALVNSGIALLITPIIPWLIGKFGKKNVFQYCGLFTVVGGVSLFFVPAGALVLALVFLAIKGVGASLINTVMFGLEADTVEYGEWKTGKRSEGATYALFSFTRKITQSIGGALGAAMLAAGGYISASAANPSPVQPESALTTIRFTIGPLPAIAAVLAMLVFWKYPLTDKVFDQIRDESEARKAVSGHLVLSDGEEIETQR